MQADVKGAQCRPQAQASRTWYKDLLDRETYWGAFAFNFVAGTLPALYNTLSKLWVGQIDQSSLVTTDLYNYLSRISDILNDSLPRVAWLVIGDGATRSMASRLELAYTLIGAQALLGSILMVLFISGAPFFAQSFMPADIWASSVRYLRIVAPITFVDLINSATATAARALDQPDVSVMINMCASLANIILDLLLISRYHLPSVTPSIHLQGGIRLACHSIGSLAGVLWLAWNIRRLREKGEVGRFRIWPSWRALKVLLRPAVWMFLESLTRNGIYLWFASRVATLGHAYATALGLFQFNIRWGLVMVPASAFFNASLTFVGHAWADWRKDTGPGEVRPTATWEHLKAITAHAVRSMIGAFAVEVGLCIFFTIGFMREYAYFISNSHEVADIVCDLWRVEWCYLVFAIGWQASTVLIATVPHLYFYAEVSSNVGWMLPWAAVLTASHVPPADAWAWVTICQGGAVLVGAFSLGLCLVGWTWGLRRGKISVTPVKAELREPQQQDQS